MAIRYENGIKRPGQIHQWTEEQVREMVKCSQDPMYFGERYYRIQHPDRGELTIKLHPFQKELLNLFMNNQQVLGCVGRQAGKCFLDSSVKIQDIITNEIYEIKIDRFFSMIYDQLEKGK